MTDLAPELNNLLDELEGVYVLTPTIDPIAPDGGALVFWNDASNEGIIIQPLYSDRDRAALRRQMRQIVDEQSPAPVRVDARETVVTLRRP